MDSILLVLPPIGGKSADSLNFDLGYAYGITSCLSRASDVTILLLCDCDVRQYEVYLKRNFGFQIRIKSLTEIESHLDASHETRSS